MGKRLSRRRFVSESSAAFGAVWISSNVVEIAKAQEHAHRVSQSPNPVQFEFFSVDQSGIVEAITAQIIPTDDTPGAREARVVYFIDRALVTFAADQRQAFVKGIQQVNSKARKLFPKVHGFLDLSQQQQAEVLKAIEKTAFFELIRTFTIIGMFANPEYGGNHGKTGWKLIGFEDRFGFSPPFGFYDREHQVKQ